MQRWRLYPLELEVAREDGPLAGVHALAATQELGHEGRVEGIEVDGGHVVNGDGHLFLEEVVALVEEDLEQHVDEVEEHRRPEQLLGVGGMENREPEILTFDQYMQDTFSIYDPSFLQVFLSFALLSQVWRHLFFLQPFFILTFHTVDTY